MLACQAQKGGANRRQRRTHGHGSRNRIERAMDRSTQGAPHQGKGVHAPARRAEPATPRPAVGGRHQGLCVRRTHGKRTLAELFDGRSQLIVYHFMFGPDWKAGCPHCSRWADNFNGIIVHLNQRDVTMIAVSRAPYAKLAAYEARMGWSFTWVSSHDTDFNFDYRVSFTPEELAKKQALFNYRIQDPGASIGRASASSARTRRAACSTPIRPTRAASTC